MNWASLNSSRLSIANWLSSRPVFATWYSAMRASGDTSFSVIQVWNLTASAPLARAAAISSRASAGSPLWFTPASAMMKQGCPAPTRREPMEMVSTTRTILLILHRQVLAGHVRRLIARQVGERALQIFFAAPMRPNGVRAS